MQVLMFAQHPQNKSIQFDLQQLLFFLRQSRRKAPKTSPDVEDDLIVISMPRQFLPGSSAQLPVRIHVQEFGPGERANVVRHESGARDGQLTHGRHVRRIRAQSKKNLFHFLPFVMTEFGSMRSSLGSGGGDAVQGSNGIAETTRNLTQSAGSCLWRS